MCSFATATWLYHAHYSTNSRSLSWHESELGSGSGCRAYSGWLGYEVWSTWSSLGGRGLTPVPDAITESVSVDACGPSYSIRKTKPPYRQRRAATAAAGMSAVLSCSSRPATCLSGLNHWQIPRTGRPAHQGGTARFRVSVLHQWSPTVTCSHLQSPAVTYSHLQSPTVTCSHRQSPAVTYSHLQSPTVTCSHRQSPAVTDRHRRSPTVTPLTVARPWRWRRRSVDPGMPHSASTAGPCCVVLNGRGPLRLVTARLINGCHSAATDTTDSGPVAGDAPSRGW